MALLDACACARTFRVVVVMVIASAVVGLCQHVLVSERHSQIGEEALVPAVGTQGGPDDGAIGSTDRFEGHSVTRSVAVKHIAAAGGEQVESSEEKPWGVPAVADKRSLPMVPRGRGLRTSQRPAFPCNLPAGTCQPWETCCASACVTVSSNPSHCGRCGHLCSAKRACCSGKCRRLTTDEKNCGQCGFRCPSGTECLFGLCGYSS